MTPKRITLLAALLFFSFSAHAENLIPEIHPTLSKDKAFEKTTSPSKDKTAKLVSNNRVMTLDGINPNQPSSAMKEMRRLNKVFFSNKSLINPVAGQRKLTLVHTPGHEHTGGFFGPNVRGRKHLGIDIQAKVGSKIQASGHGKVHHVGNDRRGYGLYVILRHETVAGKIFETRYAHLSKVLVKAGDNVLQGDLIGVGGKTGNARPAYVLPHVHFEYREVIDGKAVAVNPLPHLVKTVPSNLKNYFAKEGLTLKN